MEFRSMKPAFQGGLPAGRRGSVLAGPSFCNWKVNAA